MNACVKRVRRERIPAWPEARSIEPARFMCYKVFVDGAREFFGHKRNLTMAECRDTDRFPLGKLLDESSGRLYSWAYGLMPEYL